MRLVRTALGIAALFSFTGLASVPAEGADWPRWLGPQGNGVSPETGLLSSWAENGPPVLWRIPLGGGFSAVSVVKGKAYTMYSTETEERVVCLDAKDGTIVWETTSGEKFTSSYGDGPRATPSVDADRVYSLGAAGSLLCLDAASGDRRWGFNVLEKFGGKNIEFGLSASPAVIGDRLLITTGTSPGSTLAAIDKITGEVLWTSLSDKGGYSTPIEIEVGGTRQIVLLTGEAVVGVASEDGKELWRCPWITTLDANVATPIFHDGRLFISSGYATGCALFQLSVENGAPAVEQLWANKDMKNYFSTSILIDGYLYGFNNTMLTCMQFATGDVAWRQRGFNRGSLIAADEKLIVLGERGTLALAEVSPKDYHQLATVQIFDDKTWTVPTLSDGKLFLRNEAELVCLDLTP